MPIRYWEMIWAGDVVTYASRGVNGIDGQVSTAVGIARACSSKVHCLIGDITFLYDFNIMVEKLPANLEIWVIDNKGGRIFERVNVSDKMILSEYLPLNELIPGGEFGHNKINIIAPSLSETRNFWEQWNEL